VRWRYVCCDGRDLGPSEAPSVRRSETEMGSRGGVGIVGVIVIVVVILWLVGVIKI